MRPGIRWILLAAGLALFLGCTGLSPGRLLRTARPDAAELRQNWRSYTVYHLPDSALIFQEPGSGKVILLDDRWRRATDAAELNTVGFRGPVSPVFQIAGHDGAGFGWIIYTVGDGVGVTIVDPHTVRIFYSIPARADPRGLPSKSSCPRSASTPEPRATVCRSAPCAGQFDSPPLGKEDPRMLFPVSGVETNPLIPVLVAFGVSFFTSMGGVSGAFLLLPFQISFLGYTHPSVSATNQVFNVVAIPSGVYRYFKEGRMVWPLTWVVVAGTPLGVFIGAVIRIGYLPNPRNFKLFAAAVLLYIGARMVKDLIRKPLPGMDKSSSEKRFQELVREHRRRDENARKAGGRSLPGVRVLAFSLSRIRYEFYGEKFDVPVLGVFALSFIVGIVGGIYGIGGGAIIAPFFVSIFGLPVYTVAGAALMGSFVTSVAGVIFYQAIAPFYPNMSIAPDWILGALFGLGGVAGMYMGARFQKFVPAKAINWMLSAVIVFTALKYVLDFLQ